MFWALFLACADVEDAHDHDHDHNHGVAAGLTLSFAADGEEVTFSADDDGTDLIVLEAGTQYTLSVAIFEDGDEGQTDITDEISDDAEAHQLFFMGDGIDSEASTSDSPVLQIRYADSDASGLPIGLDNTAEAIIEGDGTLRVVVRHMPPEGDVAVKDADAASAVAEGGLAAIGGDNDVDVTFDLSVSPAP